MQIEIAGKQVFYEVQGEGRPVVFLHGWGTDHRSFAKNASFLAQRFKVYGIDFLGFGESGMPSEPMTVEDYAVFTEQVLEKLSITDPILIGHSFGGRVIIVMAGKRQYAARKIILADSAGVKPKRSGGYYLRTYSFKACKKLAQTFLKEEKAEQAVAKLRKQYGSDDYNNCPPVLRQTFNNVVNEDLTPYLPGIKAPTLLIWGANDDATPVSDGKLMESKIADAGLCVLQNAGHYSFLDQPYAFNTIVDTFLEPDRV